MSARFASTVGNDTLRASACGLKPAVTIDGRTYMVDVIVEGRRCDSAPTDGRLPLRVHAEAGEVRHVVLDMSAPGVRIEALQATIADIQRVLAARVAIDTTLQPIAIRAAGFPTSSAQDVPRFDARAWHRMHHHRDAGRVVAIVVPSLLAGVALFVGMGFALASSHGMYMNISGW